MTDDQQRVHHATRQALRDVPPDRYVARPAAELTTLCDAIDAETRRADGLAEQLADAEKRAAIAEAKSGQPK